MAKMYKIAAVERDWKDSYKAKELTAAMKFCGEDSEFTDVGNTGGDFYIMICANPPITPDEAQDLFDTGDLCIMDKDFEGTLDDIKNELKERLKGGFV